MHESETASKNRFCVFHARELQPVTVVCEPKRRVVPLSVERSSARDGRVSTHRNIYPRAEYLREVLESGVETLCVLGGGDSVTESLESVLDIRHRL